MNQDTDVPEPCPFCGKALEIREGVRLRSFQHPISGIADAQCHGANVVIEIWPAPQYDALARWNRRADRSARPAVEVWQPIETAPKDGTFVLCVEPSGHRHIMQWYTPSLAPEGGFWRARVADGPGWHPTHWQPLPAPPALTHPDTQTMEKK